MDAADRDTQGLPEIGSQVVCFDAPVFRAIAPISEVIVAKTVGTRVIGEKACEAVLSLAFGAGCFQA